MAIKSIPLTVDRNEIEKKVEEERNKGGGFLLFKSEPEKISYFCLLCFPSVYITYKAPKTVNKTTVMEDISTILEPWLGEGRTNMPNESAAELVKYSGFSQIQNGFYLPWSIVEEDPETFVENFLRAKKSSEPDQQDFEVLDVCYLPRFIVKLERSEEERYLVYNFEGKKIEVISERLSKDPYYRERVETNMREIP